MNYRMTSPCDACPFLIGSGFTFDRLVEHASGEFPCHKTCNVEDGAYVEKGAETPHCAGALIFNEQRGKPHQLMRICERLGLYDRTQLNMQANIGRTRKDYGLLKQLLTPTGRPRKRARGIRTPATSKGAANPPKIYDTADRAVKRSGGSYLGVCRRYASAARAHAALPHDR